MVEAFYKLISIFEGTYTFRILRNFFDLIQKVGPYFVISSVIGVLCIYAFQERKWIIEKRMENMGILLAGVIGLASPFPIYIAVPLGLSLISTGIPFSVVMTFIVASPLMNPSIFFLTYALLGVPMAFARLISAYSIALSAGFISKWILRSFKIRLPIKPIVRSQEKRSAGGLFLHYFRKMAKYFIVAIFLSSVIKALVSPELIGRVLGGQSKTSVLVAIALGVPLYNCGGAAVPVIQTLMEMGMNRGSALAFFISGPATKLETMYIFKSQFGGMILLYYMMIVISGALFCGTLYLI